MSKELIEELNEQVLTYDEWAREKCIEKLASDRIKQLEAERDSFYMEYRIKCDEQTKALHVERDELMADAMRYRWFRLHLEDPDALAELLDSGVTPSPKELDAAIDAAIGEK